MNTKIEYSELLSNILEKNQNKCVCPEFLEDLKTAKRESDGLCLFEHNKKFGPNCQFASQRYQNTLGPSLANCTCYLDCICDTAIKKPTLPNKVNIARDHSFVKSNCICEEPCLCKSDDAILNKEPVIAVPHCNRSKCTCSICLCQNTVVSRNLFPQPFRHKIKTQPNQLMTDEMMKKECEEIKKLINDHERDKIKDCEKRSNKDKKSITISKDHISIETNSSIRRKKSAVESSNRSSISKKSIQVSCHMDEAQSQCVKGARLQKKGRTTSKKNFKNYLKKQKASRNRKPNLKKTLQMRYYYSGSTKHYGLQGRHDKCTHKPELVPKHMGWLWNFNDPTKGVRERKGWPPGFIGKSISNMIQEMKSYKHELISEDSKHFEPRRQLRFSPTVGTVQKEPKEEKPLLHILKKGRTYNITFCPKGSDEDIEPIPIPLKITQKKHESDTESSDSTLELEFHSPKPLLKQEM